MLSVKMSFEKETKIWKKNYQNLFSPHHVIKQIYNQIPPQTRYSSIHSNFTLHHWSNHIQLKFETWMWELFQSWTKERKNFPTFSAFPSFKTPRKRRKNHFKLVFPVKKIVRSCISFCSWLCLIAFPFIAKKKRCAPFLCEFDETE